MGPVTGALLIAGPVIVYREEVLKIQLWGVCVAVMLCIFARWRLDG